jgi:tetratricopeptide (TPR) repeat protein
VKTVDLIRLFTLVALVAAEAGFVNAGEPMAGIPTATASQPVTKAVSAPPRSATTYAPVVTKTAPYEVKAPASATKPVTAEIKAPAPATAPAPVSAPAPLTAAVQPVTGFTSPATAGLPVTGTAILSSMQAVTETAPFSATASESAATDYVTSYISFLQSSGASTVSFRKKFSPELDKTRSYWFNARGFLSQGDVQSAERELAKLREEARDMGIWNLPLFADALCEESMKLAKSGKFDPALRLVGIAKDIAPDVPLVYLTMASINIMKSKGAVFEYLSLVADGFRAANRNFLFSVNLAGNMLLLGIITLFLFFSIFAAIMVVNSAKIIAHDISFIPEIVPLIAVVIIAMMPVIFSAGLLVIIAVWLTMSFPYMNLKERVVTGMFFAMLFLVPKALDTATPFILYHGSGNIDEIAHMRDWEWDIGAEQKLLKKTEENTEDPEPYLSLGIYYKKKDDAQGAVSMLEKALAKKPGMARALINLGNAHFAAGRLDKAIECYRQAIGSEDKYASAHYNLGFSLLKKNPLSTEGNNEVEKSKVMNRPRIEAHEGIFSPIIANRCMLDEEISNGELWARLLAPSDARKRLNAWIWRWLVTGLSLENSYICPRDSLRCVSRSSSWALSFPSRRRARSAARPSARGARRRRRASACVRNATLFTGRGKGSIRRPYCRRNARY